MIFSDVPGSSVSRSWAPVSVLYSNLFRFRGLSKDNQFRISIGIGFRGPDDVPVIVSQKTGFVFADVWQQLKVPIKEGLFAEQLYIYARISDVQWGARGPVNFLLQEGNSMIYESPGLADIFRTSEVVGEAHAYVGPNAVIAAPGFLSLPANAKRRGGFIYQNYTNPIFVYFSDGVPAGSLDKNTAKLPKGGRIDIPDFYVGKITIDLKGQFSADPALLGIVEYNSSAAVV